MSLCINVLLSIAFAFIFALIHAEEQQRFSLANVVAKLEDKEVPLFSGMDAKVRKDNSFDYFLLALQWPGSLCRFLSPCRIPPTTTNNFTIHGLWPERNDSSYPQNCPSKAGQFDPNEITSIRDDLDIYWHDYKDDGTNFWAHEVHNRWY